MGTKISELPSVTASGIDSDDWLPLAKNQPIPESKKTTVADLAEVVTSAIAPTSTTTTFDDDFQSSPSTAWSVEAENGGEASWGGSASAFGFPSSGYLGLRCSTSGGSGCEAIRRGTALMLDADRPIEIEGWISVRDNSASVSDDECQWLLGVKSADGEQAVALYAYLDGGDRVYALATVIDDTPVDIEPATFPGDLGQYVRVRVRVTPTGSTLEVAAEDGEYDVLATSGTSPTECVYFPVLSVSRDSGAGDRTVVVDRVRGSSARSVTLAGAPIEDTTELVAPITDHGALTGLSDDDHTQYLKADGTRALSGNISVSPSVTIDGRDLSVDGAKLDGIESGAQVTSSARVLAALAANVNPIDFGSVTLENINTPGTDDDAANKGYVDLQTHPQYTADPGTSHGVTSGDHGFIFGATHASSSLTIDVGNGGIGVPAPGTVVTFIQMTAGYPLLLATSGGFTICQPPGTLPRSVNALYSKIRLTYLDSSKVMVEGDLAGEPRRVIAEDLASNTNDWTPADPHADVIMLTNSNGGPITVSGLNMGSSQIDVREITIVNVTPAGPDDTVLFSENDSGSTITNRFATPSGNGIPLANQGGIRLRYTTAMGAGTPGRWSCLTEMVVF